MAEAAAGAAAANSEGGAAAAGAGKDDKGAGAAGAAAGAAGAEGKGAEAGAGGKGAGEGGAAAAAGKGKEAPAGAPEKYDLKLPEGGRLAKGDLAYIEETARKAGWTNEDAQAAIEEHNSALVAQNERWIAEVKADKDLGGDKLEATQQLTKAGIDFLFPKGDAHREEFLDFLNRGGAGNNINVVRALARIGKQQREDGNISGAGGTGDGPRSPEDVLYKTTPASS